MSNIDKILDRVRKLFALADHSDNEAEAALAASRAAKLMEEYQLTEAFVRLDNPEVKAEPIVREARLEPDAPLTNRKRIAWKETISSVVAKDLGVHEFFRWHTSFGGRRSADVRGFGRESAVQTWQYTCQYLWRQIDELAEQAATRQTLHSMGGTRATRSKTVGVYVVADRQLDVGQIASPRLQRAPAASPGHDALRSCDHLSRSISWCAAIFSQRRQKPLSHQGCV